MLFYCKFKKHIQLTNYTIAKRLKEAGYKISFQQLDNYEQGKTLLRDAELIWYLKKVFKIPSRLVKGWEDEEFGK